MTDLTKNIKISGRASFSVIDKHGNEKEFLDEDKKVKGGEFQKNTILDSFFTRVNNKDNPTHVACLRVGTGSGTTNVTQTTLNNTYPLITGSWPYASPANSVTNVDGVVTMTATWTFTFDIGQLDGNFSEIGLIYDAYVSSIPNNTEYNNHPSNHDVHTRLLIKDSAGNPTTITVKSDEQLRVTYSIDALFNAVSIEQLNYSNEGTTTPIEVSRIWTGYGIFQSIFQAKNGDRINLTTSDKTCGGVGVEPTNTSNRSEATTTYPYLSGGKKGSYYEFGLGAANYPIKSLSYSDNNSDFRNYNILYKWEFTDTILKNNTQKFSFKVENNYVRG